MVQFSSTSLKLTTKIIVSILCCDFVSSDKQEQQCRQMMAGLDKVARDLEIQERAIQARMRPPLELKKPLQDSGDRLQDLRVITGL